MKDGVSKMVGDKVVCARWSVTVCERWCVTKWCERLCVKDGVSKIVYDKVVCERWCVTKMVCEIVVCCERWCVKDGAWQTGV